MKKTIKLLTVIVSLSLLLTSFVACGKSEEKDDTTIEESTTETSKTKVEPTLFGDWVDITIGDSTVHLPEVTFVINGNTVKMPCTLESFLEQSELTITSFEDLPLGFEPGSYNRVFFGEDEFISIEVGNPASKTISAYECLVYSVNVYGQSHSNNQIPIGFRINNKIASSDNVRETFGDANYEYDDFECFHILSYQILKDIDGIPSGAAYQFADDDDDVYVEFIYAVYGLNLSE